MKKSSALALLLVVVMIAAVFAGCQQKVSPTPSTAPSAAPTEAPAEPTPAPNPLTPEDPVTLTFLWPFANSPKWAGTKIGDLVTEQTGITWEFSSTQGNATEYHNLLVSSRDFPDVLTMDKNTDLKMYLEANALQPLESVMMENAPTVYSILSLEENDNLIGAWKNMVNSLVGQQELYFMGMSLANVNRPGTTPPKDFFSPELIETALQGMSAYFLYPTITEISIARPDTLDEIYQIYKNYDARYGGDGVHYALGGYANGAGASLRYGAYLYGYRQATYGGDYMVYKEGEDYVPTITVPEVKDYILFLNRCYREGLMDPEAPLMSDDDAIMRHSNGDYLSHLGGSWVIAKANTTLLNTESTKNMMYCPVAIVRGEGYTGPLWQSNKSSVGWRMIGVTEDCERPEKYFQFLEWLYTEPGAMLMFGWGFEDVDYFLNADGQPDLTAAMVEQGTGDYYWNLGLSAGDMYSYLWAMMPMVSRTPEGFAIGHQLAPIRTSGTGGDARFAAIEADGWFWSTDFRGMFFKDPTLVGIPMDRAQTDKWTVATSTINDSVNNIIMAQSEAEASSMYDAMVTEFVSGAAMEYVEYVNTMYSQYAGN